MRKTVRGTSIASLAILAIACGSSDGDSRQDSPNGSGGATTQNPVSGVGSGGSGTGGNRAAGTGGSGSGGTPATSGSGGMAMASPGSGGMIASGSGGMIAPGSGGVPGGASGAAAMDGGPPMPSSGCGKMAMTGQFQQEIMAADMQRSYYISIPDDYDPNTPQRLVFGYHGSNYTGKMMRQYLDLEKTPLLSGTVFVYPDGLPLPNEPDNVAWVLTDGGRDLVFFDTLLESLESTYCIDQQRIFVNGQSFGGLMTNAVGCLRGDVVRAIAVVAGSGPYGACKGEVAVWITHGMDDMNVPFSSGEMSRDHWVMANHCASTTMPGTPTQCQVYDGCDAGFPVIWCPHVNDGGHQEPSFGRDATRQFLSTF
jgi:poly(3-hydroxybutyrate) depolymerase